MFKVVKLLASLLLCLMLPLSAAAQSFFFQGTEEVAPAEERKTEALECQCVTLYEAVTEASANRVVDAFRFLSESDSKKPIMFYIDSPGGTVFDGLKIIDAMEASGREVWTVNVAEAASMAAFIFSHGDKRIMLPNAVLMFHYASTGYTGQIDQIAAKLNLLERVMTRLEQHVSARSTMSLEELKRQEASELWILSEEALAKKLTDEVKPLFYPTMTPKPKTDKEKEDEGFKFTFPFLPLPNQKAE